MSAFRWTAARDRELRANRHEGFSWRDTARLIGCTEAEAKARLRALRGSSDASGAGVEKQGCVRVPAPVRVVKAGLIDLTHAPSMMEQAAARWNAQRDTGL